MESPSPVEPSGPDRPDPSALARFWTLVTESGLRDPALRYAPHLLLLGVVVAAVWTARLNLTAKLPTVAPIAELEATPVPQPEPLEDGLTLTTLPAFTLLAAPPSGDLVRTISLHTDIPTRPRTDVQKYVVQKGDTLFGIAEKFGLKPETLLWGNFFVLKDSPHSLRPGQELNILPVNGTYHYVTEGQGINGIAKFYNVDPQVIVDWPGNKLETENPALVPDTWLIIPGGTRAFNGWPEVPQITRKNTRKVPVDAGPGQCSGTYSGTVGIGSFVWPSSNRRLSGYNYTAYHPGIDIGEKTGDPIYAADGGVVVYAGWNNWGYGNMVVIDHGNGWQTLYAHLSGWSVVCGQSVSQGAYIGAAGSTGNSSGPHLHFEMRNATYGRVNPFNFLP